MFLALLVTYTVIAITAAQWWLRPLLVSFDRRYRLRPCKESDFYFFAAMWVTVLVMVATYAVWEETVIRVWKKSQRNARNDLTGHLS